MHGRINREMEVGRRITDVILTKLDGQKNVVQRGQKSWIVGNLSRVSKYKSQNDIDRYLR